ncbi:hypothetical protein D3C72_1677260 [compost metagenome]
MHADGFSQIAVAGLVVSNFLAQPRQYIEGIPVVGGRQGLGHARKLQHQQLAARLQHPRHFSQRTVLVGHVAQAEGHADTVEVTRGERQALGVAHGGGQQQAGVGHAVAAHAQHGIVDVGQPDLARGAGALGESLGQVTRAAGNVQHLHAGADGGAANGEGLPDAVQARRHEVVHDVVALGDRMEDFSDLTGLFAFRHRLEAEMRG